MNFLRPDLLRAFAAQQLDRAIALENEAREWRRAAGTLAMWDATRGVYPRIPTSATLRRYGERFLSFRDQARADRDRYLRLAQVADTNAERLAARPIDLDAYPSRSEELERGRRSKPNFSGYYRAN